jgi:DNA-binding beta-propeller fold protein YncE
MFRAYKSWVVSLGLLFSLSASATGYYNLSMQWKGGINPYRLGAEGAVVDSWHRTTSLSTSGTGDGMMSGPMGVAVDSSHNLYVVDYNNNRIIKYNSSGNFQGWIGKIATSPTGGASGCNGAAVGTLTPGFCKGGGLLAQALDSSGNLYVGDDGNNRMIRFSVQQQ